MLSESVYEYAVVGLLLNMMGVLTGLFSPGQADTDLGVVSVQVHLPVVVTSAMLYALLLWNLVSSPRRYVQAISKQLSLLPLLGICMISAIWSDDPSLVLRRVLIMYATVLIGLMIGTDFTVLEIGRMLAAASFLHLVLCAGFFLVARHYMFAPEDPAAFKGLTTHKNVFGFEQGLAALAFAFCPFKRLAALRWPLSFVSIGMLVWSHSSGSFIATAIAFLLLPFLLVSKLTPKQRLPFGLAVFSTFASMVLLICLNIDRIPALFSKDATLTGRTQLWALVKIAIDHRPLLGYGFDAFWRGLQGDSLAVIRGVGWLVPTAHNGYLDLLLSIGAVGAAVFGFTVFQYFLRSLGMTTSSRGSSRFFPVVFLAFLLTYNLNESALLTRSGLPFFLLVAFSAAMTRQSARVPSAVTAGPDYRSAAGLPAS